MVAMSKGERTENALLEAARTVFAEHGYFNARIADIARAAGRSPGSFYNYYENKAQLLDALLDQFTDDMVAESMRAMSADPYESVRGAVAVYLRHFRQNIPEMIGMVQMSMTDLKYDQRWREVRAVGVRGIGVHLAAAQTAGHLDADADLGLMASAIMSMLESFCWVWVAGKGDLGVDRPADDHAIDTLASLWYAAMYGPHGPGASAPARSDADRAGSAQVM